MSVSSGLAALYRRELTRLAQEVRAFPNEEILWKVVPGVSNSAGNLALHLEGNLREYIGRQLGGIAYQRTRDREFADRGLSAGELAARIEDLRQSIPEVIAGLSTAQLEEPYPEDVLGSPLSTGALLASLLGHFNYHLGQIDYLRRTLTGSGALPLAGL